VFWNVVSNGAQIGHVTNVHDSFENGVTEVQASKTLEILVSIYLLLLLPYVWCPVDDVFHAQNKLCTKD